jgi:2-hydroxychromene-2-carboxylate isomerase
MSERFEYFYDFVSPYSYLAQSQIPALVARTGAELIYRPFLLGGVMQSSGNSPPATVPAKAKYMPVDIGRWLDRYGIELNFNPFFPVNTVKAMRGALVALDDGCHEAYNTALFEAMWLHEKNVAELDVLAEVISEAGLDADSILKRIANEEVKERLKANTAEAVERGAFGAPTFFVGDEMFFGNDRLDFLEQRLAG